MIGRARKLAPEEAALWQRVIASVRPLDGVAAAPVPPLPPTVVVVPKTAPVPARTTKPRPEPRSDTLDGSWDRRLSRGLVAPESTIDLHGHSLDSAYARLDRGLAQALARGDRLLLLVTGKPPAPESRRPHTRGAIRAAVGDWIAASRHADRIAAVRGAHPRHGGGGALYIVLRRSRPPDSRNS